MALTDEVRELMRAGFEADPIDRPDLDLLPGGAVPGPAPDPRQAAPAEPSLPDLEAAVELVSLGLATRVVLTGFPSWPGLLWHAYRLAEAADVLILPTVVRPGGRVDIVIARDIAANG